MTKRFEKNKNGKVEFTETELKALLDEVYNHGYNDGKYNSGVVWNSPYRYDDWWNKPVITWCSSTDGNSATASSSNITLDNCTTASSSNATLTGTVTLNEEDISHLHVK